ncbi:MAG: hypothetical protein Ct9H90mP18_06460 [Gammaproteobacteria bacterium]|nr:MAG: hypothetical protein Ct9H90mP18_06460 [Gammaproteobacteria bacterium]
MVTQKNKSLNSLTDTGIAYDDVLLVPQYSEVLPNDVSLSTRLTKSINIKIPILSAAMDTVTESQMAISLASAGGIGIIHKNMGIKEHADQIRFVKKHESGVIREPLTASPGMTVDEIYGITNKYNISGVPVVENNQLVGIITSRDLRFVENLDMKISQIMTPKDKLVTVREDYTKEEVVSLLRENRIEKILITNKKFELKGMITFKDIQKTSTYPDASKDTNGSLLVGGAIGTTDESIERAKH